MTTLVMNLAKGVANKVKVICPNCGYKRKSKVSEMAYHCKKCNAIHK